MATARDPATTGAGSPAERAVWTLYSVVFIDYLQITFIVPFLAPLVASVPGGSVKMIVVIETVNFAGSALGQPLLGFFSDRFGRRPVLLFSQLGSTISCALLALSSRFWMLILARAISGVCGSTNAIAFSYIGDVSSEQELEERNPRLTSAIMLGACTGPLLGSLLYAYGGVEEACLTVAGLNLLCVMCVCCFLQESTKPPSQAEPLAASEGSEAAEQLPLAVWFLVLAKGLQGPMKAIFTTFVNPYVIAHLFEGDEHRGTAFFQITLTVSSAMTFLLLFFLYRHLVRCMGLRALLLLAMVAGMIGGVLNGIVFPSAPWVFSIGYTLWVVGFQMFTPAIQTAIVKCSPPSKLGFANGLASGCQSVMIAITPLALWPLYEREPAGVFFLLGGLFVPIAIIALTVNWQISCGQKDVQKMEKAERQRERKNEEHEEEHPAALSV